jgi:hypothetical protein
MIKIVLLFAIPLIFCSCISVVENKEIKFGGNKKEILDTLKKIDEQRPSHEYVIYDKQKIK